MLLKGYAPCPPGIFLLSQVTEAWQISLTEREMNSIPKSSLTV